MMVAIDLTIFEKVGHDLGRVALGIVPGQLNLGHKERAVLVVVGPLLRDPNWNL